MGPTFEQFAAARTPALLRYAHVLTGDRSRAEDLVQDGLAGVYRHWSRVGDGNPEGYVRRSILHGYLGRWRRTGRFEVLSSTPPDRVVADPTGAADDRAALRVALDGLPPRMRAVLVLRYYEDLTETQTAAALGVTVGTVKSTTSKALTRLRAHEAIGREALR